MAKILVVEDDPALSSLLAKWLKDENHVTDVANTGEDALHLLRCYSYDLLVLDWGLPGEPGINVCTKYRQGGGSSPILFLTGRNDIESKEIGLDSGADDYLTKPFASIELIARIRALLRRNAAPEAVTITIRGVSLELRSKIVSINENQVRLTAREFELLKFLMQHPNQAYGSKALLRSVWPSDSALAEQTVRSTMFSLRKKITPGSAECIIETIVGEGFIIKP